jgi:formylglycine-generating enzyme required for sulfatase activity
MVGNVEELVQDYFALDYVPAGRAINPTGPPATENRVTCGGSYADRLRLTMYPSGTAAKNVVYSNQGFRVVLEP